MAPYTQSSLGGYTQQQQQNPLQWLIDANQQAGNAVVEQITNLPGNLLKIGQGALEDLVESSVNQAKQREENLKTGGWTGFKQKMTDSAGMLMEGGTVGGWVDVAGMGLMEASGAAFVPENLRLPLLIGGMAVSAADGTPSPLTSRQLTRLSKISTKASSKLKTTGLRTADGAPILEQKPASTGPEKRIPQRNIPEEDRVFITDIPRDVREQPPVKEMMEFANEQGISPEVAKKVIKDATKTFNQQKQFARLAAKTNNPLVKDAGGSHAGHYYRSSTESAQHLLDEPGKRGHTPPTTGETARPQPALNNLADIPNDHINMHIARSVGISTTWFDLLKRAQKQSQGIRQFNWKADLSPRGQKALLSIHVNLPRSQALKARDAILADPRNLSRSMSKQEIREIQIDLTKNDLDQYTTD